VLNGYAPCLERAEFSELLNPSLIEFLPLLTADLEASNTGSLFAKSL